MNLETKITIYKFTPQLFTLTRRSSRPFWEEGRWDKVKENISSGDYEECSSSKKSTCS